ncbi:MAG: dCTP deaminase [Euryarchaeota archaeon]|nr:dCTP deaminase [Euryarchaeota archaeon]
MCILSDQDIRERLEQKTLGIEPYQEKHLTPNGYDLTVKEVVLRASQEKIHAGEAVVPPMSSFLISTKEYVRMPPDAAGQLWIRSSYARRGVLAAFGKVEAGFEGELTIGCFNSSHEPVKVPVGDRFCQIAFEKMHRVPEKLYKDRSGNYQGQRGVTLAR